MFGKQIIFLFLMTFVLDAAVVYETNSITPHNKRPRPPVPPPSSAS